MRYKNPLSWDNKFIYSNNTKVAQINHDKLEIRCLGYFSSDIKVYVKDIANSLNGKLYKIVAA